MMDIKWQLVAAVAFSGAVVGAAALGSAAMASYLSDAPKDGHPTCWTDPEPHVILDFDFYAFVGGRPVRCGYPEPKTSVLPRVLGGQSRAVYSTIMCYSMVAAECTEGAP